MSTLEKTIILLRGFGTFWEMLQTLRRLRHKAIKLNTA